MSSGLARASSLMMTAVFISCLDQQFYGRVTDRDASAATSDSHETIFVLFIIPCGR